MFKSRKYKKVPILIIAMLILSIATVYVSGDKLAANLITPNLLEGYSNSDSAINSITLPEQVLETDDTHIRDLIVETGKSKSELEQLKAKFGNWEDVKVKLATDLYLIDIDKNKLSEDKIRELHQKGYIVGDILISQRLAPLCGKPVEELLVAKGKSDRYSYNTVKDSNGNEKKVIARIEGRTWDSVLTEFGVNAERLEKKLGISTVKLNSNNQNLSIFDTIDIALQSAYMNKSFSTVISEVEQNGKNKLLQQANQDKQVNAINNKLSIKAKPGKNVDVELEEHLIRTYKITKAEIELCKQNSISDIRDIAYSKSLVGKYNVTLEQVFKLKKERGSWEEVVKELEGNK